MPLLPGSSRDWQRQAARHSRQLASTSSKSTVVCTHSYPRLGQDHSARPTQALGFGALPASHLLHVVTVEVKRGQAQQGVCVAGVEL